MYTKKDVDVIKNESEIESKYSWPDGTEELVNRGFVSVSYDEFGKPHFSLTDKGVQAYLQTDRDFN